jgi:hypothetical protein
LGGAFRPPFVNATVANQFACVEESAGIGAAKELLAVRTGVDAEQGEGVFQAVEIELMAG